MMDYFNYIADIIVIVIILAFVFIFAHKGLVESILHSCKWLISLVATYLLYPIVSSLIRKTFIFTALKSFIFSAIGLDSVTTGAGAGQVSAINSLSLPEALKGMLVDNNNSVIYELLGVDTLKDYIAGYIANIFLNIIVSMLVFILIVLGIRLVTGTLELAVKLPIIKQINGFGGGVLGLFWGVVAVWVIMAVSTLLIATPFFTDIITAIDSSFIAKILYDNNVIMNVVIAKLFGWG